MATAIGTQSRARGGGSPRTRALVLGSGGVCAFICYLVIAVPVAAPLPGGHLLFFCPLAPLPLPRAQITHFWTVAVAGAAVVTLVDAAALLLTWRALRRAATPTEAPARSPLRLERVSLRAAAVAGAASVTVLLAGVTQGYAMWVSVGTALLPWLPLVVLESVWKYEHYGFWAIFGVAVLLQIGHLGEHSVQVVQLLLYDGRLARAHGVFGQLDFETIHFFWDSAIWLTLCVVLTRFARGNRWLWVAFAAASLHEVEHLYLFWIYSNHPWFYVHGGLAGIMGNGGLIGSPLARPYLHFAYNFAVVIPMVLAFVDQSKRVGYRRRPRTRALPA